VATRTSGVTKGIAFLGPLQLEGKAYFEIQVTEMEARGSQSLAIGLCSSLPQKLRAERARDLDSCCMLGYDLPKVFANGVEVGKLKHWRPLKDLTVGSRVGLLIERETMELSVFVNGTKKVSATIPSAGQPWPSEVWGVVDVHGNVRSVRLSPPKAPLLAKVPPPPPAWTESEAVPKDLTAATAPARLDSTQALSSEDAAGGFESTAAEALSETSSDAAKRAAAVEVAAGPKKRIRLNSHPCGCMVHLLGKTGNVVHIPRMGDFVIGRNPKSCNLTLDSQDVPNMISRRHAVIVSADDSVMVVDCESLNGTFVNGRRVGRETLRQGDKLVVGNPAQSPEHFKFEVSMPVASEK